MNGSVPDPARFRRRALAIARIERFHHIHALDDFPKWRKAHAVKPLVVAVIDEDLGGACVGARRGEGDRTLLVALGHRIVGQIAGVHLGRSLGVGRQAELDNESWQDAEKLRVVEVAGFHQAAETSRAQRSPVFVDLHDELTLGSLELYLVGH